MNERVAANQVSNGAQTQRSTMCSHVARKCRFAVALWGALLFSATPSSAMIDKYHITIEEQNACKQDVINICSEIEEDEDALLACMKANKARLSPDCRRVFTQGLQRRGLN